MFVKVTRVSWENIDNPNFAYKAEKVNDLQPKNGNKTQEKLK